MSSGYKKFIAEKGLADETYTADGVALIRISGTSVHNNKALQVEAVCALLNRIVMMQLYLCGDLDSKFSKPPLAKTLCADVQ